MTPNKQYQSQEINSTETVKLVKNTKVIAISEASQEQSLLLELDGVLENKRLTPLQRLDEFFQLLFSARKIISLQASDFKQWQIKFSKLISEGQKYFDFVNTVSAMDLSEVILSNYHGMMLRFEENKSEAFFDVWLSSHKRILQA